MWCNKARVLLSGCLGKEGGEGGKNGTGQGKLSVFGAWRQGGYVMEKAGDEDRLAQDALRVSWDPCHSLAGVLCAHRSDRHQQG